MSTPASADRPCAISFTDVWHHYGATTGEPSLRELNLQIAEGELMVLVGPSGCGKTTTLRLINRLLDASHGSVQVHGNEVREMDVIALRRDIGYVIQHVGLFPHRTIAQNIATVPELLGWKPAHIQERVHELLDLVGLPADLAARYPAQLSGGQQQRIGVARALAARPSILLMDEPYSAVDPVVRSALQDELRDLHQKLGTTIVLVTHDIDEAVRLGDRVAVFAPGGRLAQVATPDQLMSHPADAQVEEFLGADRHLRRLALHTLSELDLAPVPSTAELKALAVRLPSSLNGRNAVDAMVAASVQSALVLDSDEAPLGVISMDTLSTLVAS